MRKSTKTEGRVTAEMESLATAYMSHHILPPKYADDARQVAACTVAEIEYLVSWNFRHVVNLLRIQGYHGVNIRFGYPTIEIRSPREVLADE